MKRDVHGDGRPQKVSVPLCPLCGESTKNCMRLPHTEVRKCLNPSCALMFAFPQLDDLALGAAYQKFYYPAPDTGIAAYENTPEQILRQTFDKAEAELGPLAGKSLLDFGCGVGALCKVASEYGIRAVGIEADANAREKACESTGLKTSANRGRNLRIFRMSFSREDGSCSRHRMRLPFGPVWSENDGRIWSTPHISTISHGSRLRRH